MRNWPGRQAYTAVKEELGEARWDAVRDAWQEETRRYGWRAWAEERYACEEGAQPQRETIHARGARRRAARGAAGPDQLHGFIGSLYFLCSESID